MKKFLFTFLIGFHCFGAPLQLRQQIGSWDLSESPWECIVDNNQVRLVESGVVHRSNNFGFSKLGWTEESVEELITKALTTPIVERDNILLDYLEAYDVSLDGKNSFLAYRIDGNPQGRDNEASDELIKGIRTACRTLEGGDPSEVAGEIIKIFGLEGFAPKVFFGWAPENVWEEKESESANGGPCRFTIQRSPQCENGFEASIILVGESVPASKRKVEFSYCAETDALTFSKITSENAYLEIDGGYLIFNPNGPQEFVLSQILEDEYLDYGCFPYKEKEE